MGQHYPPSMKLVTKEIEHHLQKNNDLAPIFKIYKKILKVQLSYLHKIGNIHNGLSAEEIKNCFRNEKYLLAEKKLEINSDLFMKILSATCKALKEASPAAPESLLELPGANVFKNGNLEEFLGAIALFNKQELEDFIRKQKIDKKIGLDGEIISFVVFTSLSPFYSAYMREVNQQVGFTIWRQGYCPICGQTAVMARHRSENGARVLGCWLCHAEWVYPRLECPYCHNAEQKKLRFFYVVGDKARQVHVCEKCKLYLKTVDGKVLEKDVSLEVEALATGYLDVLAREEGYKPPGEAAVLN
ncbi:MAG: formate dehydrogenase accessory protein FdhE [Firmicutes bacterium]|nr:formate dehydrogenase accessory protein FdhE [Bacillota bacterium]